MSFILVPMALCLASAGLGFWLGKIRRNPLDAKLFAELREECSCLKDGADECLELRMARARFERLRLAFNRLADSAEEFRVELLS